MSLMPYAAEPPSTLDATQLVNEGWRYFNGKSTELLDKATMQLNGIATPLLSMTAPVISFTMPPIEGGTFARPVAPTAPTVREVDDAVPDAPALAQIALEALPPMPVEPDFSGLAYRAPTAPNVAVPTRPTDLDVVLDPVSVPAAPSFVMPADPAQYALSLPVIPDMQIAPFAGVRPTLNLQAPTDGLNWNYQAYDTTLIDSIKGQLHAMTLNGLALPAAIEQAIFDRARGREDVLSAQQTSEATRMLASRGLRQPAGLMAKVLTRITTQARLTSSGASRDLAIEIAKENIESIRFGLSQAIALESTLLQQHVAVQGLVLDAAKAAHAALIAIFESQVALHNAQWEGFKAEAQVYETQIRAKAQEVEIIKARIDAEKVKGDINEGLVRAYGEKVRALSSLADMYRAQVDAAKAQGEINVQRLEQVRLRLQAYGMDVDAYAKQWDAYKAQADAEATGIRYYEALGNVFGQRVSAWRGQVEAQSSRAQTQLAVNGQALDLFRATLAGVTTRVQAQSANVSAATQVFSAKTALFGTQGQVSAAESDAANRTAALRMDQHKLLFDSARENARMAADFGIKRAELAVEASRGASQVWGQLAASVLSGVNLGASTSQSGSWSWNWQGEL